MHSWWRWRSLTINGRSNGWLDCPAVCLVVFRGFARKFHIQTYVHIYILEQILSTSCSLRCWECDCQSVRHGFEFNYFCASKFQAFDCSYCSGIRKLPTICMTPHTQLTCQLKSERKENRERVFLIVDIFGLTIQSFFSANKKFFFPRLYNSSPVFTFTFRSWYHILIFIFFHAKPSLLYLLFSNYKRYPNFSPITNWYFLEIWQPL